MLSSFPFSVVPPASTSAAPKMVMADGVVTPPLVETCVLLPEEFSLKVETSPNVRVPPSLLNLLPHLASSTTGQSHIPASLLERLAPSLGHLPSPITPLSPALSPLGMSISGGAPFGEDCIKVCATRRLPAHTRYLPFSGTVRADKLPLLPCLPPMDPRQRYGSYDEVCERPTGRVRLCNWVRFVGYSLHFSPQVNMVASKVRGSVVFEVVREVAPGERLIAFLLPDMSADDTLLLPALTLLRSSIYRRTIDSIMAEAPLDLSRSLLTTPPSPPPSESLSSNTPPSLKRKPDHSPVRSPSPVPSSPTPNHSPPSTLSHFPPVPTSFFPIRRPPLGPALRDLDSSRMPPLSLTLTPSTSSGIPSNNAEGRLTFGSDSPVSSSLSSSGSLRSETTVSLMPPKRRERTMLPCSDCGKAFDRPSLLKRHIRTHTGEKPHVCDVCGKGFSTSSSLNTHRRIHSGEKPHQCGVCGKRFTASSNLYYHKMTHVKEKPHKCSLCTRSFPTPGDLRSHMFVHNGQWPHKCSVCGKGFSKLTNLRNHALLHSEMKRAERHLPTLPASLTSPPSASSSDSPLTPPAGYTPPTYSSFTPSTSRASPSSDAPPSPSTSQLSHSPPSSPSESIVLSSSSSPNSPIQSSDRKPTASESSPRNCGGIEEPLPKGETIGVRDDLLSNCDSERDSGTVLEETSPSVPASLPNLIHPLTVISSSPAALNPKKTAPPKLSFSLDSLLGSTRIQRNEKAKEDLETIPEENGDGNRDLEGSIHSTTRDYSTVAEQQNASER